ncbi:hypothetical protein MMC19_005390 [Ptychographa xylographoides]|nr:hypothetical protein [Ptychographa xylographoides]
MPHEPRNAPLNLQIYDFISAPKPPSTLLAYGVLSILLIYYVLQYLDYYPLLSNPEFLWNAIVYVTPPSLVMALDKRQRSKIFQNSMENASYSTSRTLAAKSEAMRYILGLDGAGVLTKFQRARSLSGLASSFRVFQSGSQSGNLPGLGNWDNSCYQNSVIQGLASLPSLLSFLNQTSSSQARDESPSTKLALKETIQDLNDPANAGQRLWTPTELKSMSSWQQQDAQEYYSKILDEMDKESSTSVKSRPVNVGLLALQNLNLGIKREKPGIQTISSGGHNHTETEDSRQSRFDQLPEELAPNFLRNPLEGLLAQRVGCLQCGYVEGLSLIPFNCLTVPLGQGWEYDIRDCLDDYSALESISGVECSKCTILRLKKQLERLLTQPRPSPIIESLSSTSPISITLYQSAQARLDAVNDALQNEDFSENTLLKKCQIPVKNRVSSTKSKQVVLARLPTSLVVHVNRSVFDELSGTQSKNHAQVKFPKYLDLSPWCLGETKHSKIANDIVETWSVDPSISMLPNNESDNTKASFSSTRNLYILRAVITHYGRHENGHYICYRKTPLVTDVKDVSEEDGRWWRLSDDDVAAVNEENVLQQGGVFMLFYERINGIEVGKSCGATPIAEDSSVNTPATSESLSDKLVSVSVQSQKSIHPDSAPDLAESGIDQVGTKLPEQQFSETPFVTPVVNNMPEEICDYTARQSSPSPSNSAFDEAKVDHSVMTTYETHAKKKEFERQQPGVDITAVDRWKGTAPMRTAGAGNGRGGANRAGNALSSVSSMVTAN